MPTRTLSESTSFKITGRCIPIPISWSPWNPKRPNGRGIAPQLAHGIQRGRDSPVGRAEITDQIVPLPTDVSWCNPIEKPWRQLRQDVTHLHRWADDLEALRTGIDRFLDQFAQGSLDLLRYVGLAVPD